MVENLRFESVISLLRVAGINLTIRIFSNGPRYYFILGVFETRNALMGREQIARCHLNHHHKETSYNH